MHQEFALNNVIAKYNLINRKLQDKINALIDDIVITEGDYVQYGVLQQNTVVQIYQSTERGNYYWSEL